ncbi:hypothetical protein AMATHDRAFT_71617 [Amanita thiersii Skay4041]|uniref:HECT-type E3 ubiquitin transferase n=1 Tax=Amanita thiersii Skay4041 TaxID=703135 RepID=A0A2A9NCT9_9AGAR|nr:hypothetical protein AMATHDRAFT_71617 [Amanita thiersii Skay4041]
MQRVTLFSDEQRRKINLGGTSSATSQASILTNARAQRNERLEQKQRQDSARKVQAWWRGRRLTKQLRRELRAYFEHDVLGIKGMRCLVLLNGDQEALALWSRTVLAHGGRDALFKLFSSEYRESWLVLIRKLSLLLMYSVANAPQSLDSINHLHLLTMLTSTTSTSKILGPQGPPVSAYIAEYLLRHNVYPLISQAIQSIPVESKSSPTLLPLIELLKLLSSVFQASSSLYISSISQAIRCILIIPLLPYRLPLKSLGILSASLPLSNLHLLSSSAVSQLLDALDISSRVHLLSNLVSFVSPRYQQLPEQSISSYLYILTLLLHSFPISLLDPSSGSTDKLAAAATKTVRVDDGEESDSEHATSRAPVTTHLDPPLTIDARTLKRLRMLSDSSHITSLLAFTKSHPSMLPQVIAFLLSSAVVWPATREQVLSVVGAHSGGGMVRELYRGYVRSSPLGRDENPGAILDPVNVNAWPPLIFLSDLYTQMLLTMGDDEFFGTNSSTSQQVSRNPLSLDELRSFSRRLLIVAFTLFQREGQTDWHKGSVSPNLRLTWENVRDKVTKCLLAIHSRDSRKSFVPADHWLVSSQIDMDSFIEAAIFEEQKLTDDDSVNGLLSKRQVAVMSPRLGILNNIPFAIPFEVRVSIFRHFVVNDKMMRGASDRHSMMGFWGGGRMGKTRVSVRRGHIAQDGFDRLADADLKMPIEITFIDQFGQEEAGIDGGGVFKEFLTSLSKEVFDTDRGLWLFNQKNELYPNPHAYATESHSLNWYRFIGRILGKAMYEGILVDVAFAGFFLAKWLGRQSFLDDLASLDPELYKGLIYLKHHTGNPEDLSLNFTVVDQEFGVAKTIELVPNGSNIPVTKENRLQYIQLVSHYRLSRQIKLQSQAFFEGLSDMIDPKWLRMFNQQEVQILLGGVNSPIDLNDLRRHTSYGGLYDDQEPTVQAFWKVVNSFDQEQRRALLRFVTSCSRPPLLGFKELIPNFAIRDAGTDQERLPTASTCVNLLKLPRYQSERMLREKLLKAITSGAGFDLS